MTFLLSLALLVGLAGWLDARLPWPRPRGGPSPDQPR